MVSYDVVPLFGIVISTISPWLNDKSLAGNAADETALWILGLIVGPVVGLFARRFIRAARWLIRHCC